MSLAEAPPTDPASDTPPGVSLLDHLRQQHDHIVARVAKPKTFEIGGHWNGALGITYEFPQEGADVILQAQSRMIDSKGKIKLSVDTSIDVILATAVEIMGRRPGEDWSRPLEDRPLTFSNDLADFLGVDVDGVKGKARLLCRHLFSPTASRDGVFRGDLLLSGQAGEVLSWLTETDQSGNEEFSGE